MRCNARAPFAVRSIAVATVTFVLANVVSPPALARPTFSMRRPVAAENCFPSQASPRMQRMRMPALPVVPVDRTIHFGAQSGKIQHVVFVMQENRSFDNLFQGYPKADTKPYGYDHLGNKIKLQPIPLEAPYDIDHQSWNWCEAYNDGQMNGFDTEDVGGRYGTYPEYGYVPHYESAPYFKLAHSYALGDRMFTSHIDASFVSHQYFIAGYAAGSVNLPSTWGCGDPNQDEYTITEHYPQLVYGAPVYPCYGYTTLASELDTAGLPWRFYANSPYDIWSAYQAIQYVCVPVSGNCTGPEFANNVISPETQFVSDVQGGTLDAVTWITPSCFDSDHSGCEGNGGPAWVTSIVNAVGESQFWDTTAIFVMWDEWGGWYDHVQSPMVDYDGLGFRVPLLIVSPYAKENYVSHTQYEHGSVLKFIEDTFGLPRMAASDTRANSPVDAFDFNRKPRKFKRFAGALAPAQLNYRLPDIRPVDAE